MPAMKRWTVDVYIDEDEGRTYAEARLHSGADVQLVGVGRAKLNPADRDIPEIGDELATARALSDLGHRLLIATASDIGAVTGKPTALAG
jgi:Rv2632c-like